MRARVIPVRVIQMTREDQFSSRESPETKSEIRILLLLLYVSKSLRFSSYCDVNLFFSFH